MSTSSATALFTLALEYYRAPLDQRFKVDVNQQVPAGLSHLLSSLGRSQGDNDELNRIAGALKVNQAELSNASYFYLRQLLFSAECDHYRLLGLPKGASAEEIRKRYRQLIRLFHPDRNPEGDAWDQLYAPRINTAYNILKSPQKRREYDNRLTRSQPTPEPVHKQKPVSTPKHKRRRQTPAVRVPVREVLYRSRLLQRHPKIMVWGTTLLILALLLLYAAGSSRTPMLAERDPYAVTKAYPYPERNLAAEEELKGIRPVTDEIDPAGLLLTLDENAEQSERDGQERYVEDAEPETQRLEAGSITSKEPPSPQVTADSIAKQEEISQLAPESVVKDPLLENAKRQAPREVRQSKPVVLASAATRPSPPVAPANVSTQRAADPGKKDIAPKEEVVVDNNATTSPLDVQTGFDGLPITPAGVTYASLVRPGANLRLPPGMQPEMLLLDYVSHFEAGELDKLLSLFTEEVISNEGRGKAILAQRYTDLFHRTVQRKMTISELNLAPAYGREVMLMTRVAVAVRPVGDDNWQNYAGDLILAVTRQGRNQYISRLTHNVVETGQ